MSKLTNTYTIFDLIFGTLFVLYWPYFLKSKAPSFFYVSTGSLLMLLFSPIIFLIPEQKLSSRILLFLLPTVSMVFTGMVLRRMEHPYRFFHFTKLSETPDNRKKIFREDLLIYGLIFYSSGIIMSVIYKRADFLTGSARLIGSVVLFAAPWTRGKVKNPQSKIQPAGK